MFQVNPNATELFQWLAERLIKESLDYGKRIFSGQGSLFWQRVAEWYVFGFPRMFCSAIEKLVEEAQHENPTSLALCLIAVYNVLDHAYVDTRKTCDMYGEQPQEYAMGRGLLLHVASINEQVNIPNWYQLRIIIKWLKKSRAQYFDMYHECDMVPMPHLCTQESLWLSQGHYIPFIPTRCESWM